MYVDWIFIISKEDFVQNIVKYIFNAFPPSLSLSLFPGFIYVRVQISPLPHLYKFVVLLLLL